MLWDAQTAAWGGGGGDGADGNGGRSDMDACINKYNISYRYIIMYLYI